MLVANIDQNGIEYPAFPFGTRHYTCSPPPGPWYTNINASPLKKPPTSVYSDADWAHIQANMPAIEHFRSDARRVRAAGVHGARRQAPQPDHAREHARERREGAGVHGCRHEAVLDTSRTTRSGAPTRSRRGAGHPRLRRARRVRLDRHRRTRIRSRSPLKPPIFQYAGYDTPRDTIQHLNLLASGQPQGAVDGRSRPCPRVGSRGAARRARAPGHLERLPRRRAPSTPAPPTAPSGPLAYFETDPVKPAKDQLNDRLRRVVLAARSTPWASSPTRGTSATAAHAHGPEGRRTPTRSRSFADVKLVVRDEAGNVGTYRQAVNAGASKRPGAAHPVVRPASRATETNAVLRRTACRPRRPRPTRSGCRRARKCVDVRKFAFRHPPAAQRPRDRASRRS